MPLPKAIASQLKDTREQRTVVGPLVHYLVRQGWKLEQIVFGKREWLIPRSPSEATKREKGRRFQGFPVDIAVFESVATVRDPRGLLFLVECKPEEEAAGVSQLEAYYVGEPHARLGVWTNSAKPHASAAFLYRASDGRMLPKKRLVQNLPRPGEPIRPDAVALTYRHLIAPNATVLRRVIEDLLDKVVANDSTVTRREEQLDQLCNLLLLKLESDREGSSDQSSPVFFRPLESEANTAQAIRERYSEFVALYPGVFTQDQDKKLRLTDHTIYDCVEGLSGLKLHELGIATVSLAFQVLRAEALKQGEGQYFTPQAVIEAGLRLMQVHWKDLIVDPACGTGGFLVQSLFEIKRTHRNIDDSDLSRWAQTHLYGIDKDAIGTKLTKAVMQIVGDGSAHCVRGDAIRTHLWQTDFAHLNDGSFSTGRFSVVITNPPFGQNLKVSARDARLSGLNIAAQASGEYRDTEIGILYLQRCHDLLCEGGRLGIVLPDTYFFSPNYRYILDWIKARLRPLIVANIPMEAFQGFCRAKTSFYIFEKMEDGEEITNQTTVFLNPQTCGIYKDGGPRFKRDPATGKRTHEIDNQLFDHVVSFCEGGTPPGLHEVPLREVYSKRVLVPTYYDGRYDAAANDLATACHTSLVTLGELIDSGVLKMRRGHGSPSNDQRMGVIPYVKVSDLRALRVNVNPTNLIPLPVARRLWRGQTSGLEPWDVLTPNRASSNIGEFAMILPGQEQVLLTKEVYVLRVTRTGRRVGWDPFYLIWALSLTAVRNQWRRIALMQTNREDCGDRYREIKLPKPRSAQWARAQSKGFREYFRTLARANTQLKKAVQGDFYEYLASVLPSDIITVQAEDEDLE